MALLATRCTSRSTHPQHLKYMYYIAIWAIPFWGSGMVLLHSFADWRLNSHAVKRQQRQDINLPPEFINSGVPVAISADGIDSFVLAEHTRNIGGFPLPDWQAFNAWATKLATPHLRTQAGTDIRRAWLLQMKRFLGTGYRVYESDDALVLSPLEPRQTVAAAKFITSARKRIAGILDGGMARFEEGEKSVLFIFHNEDVYYHYLGCYYPDEGEFSFSAGMFIEEGIGHFATVAENLVRIEPIIAHELTHSAVSHLNLPRWLNEGLAVNTEELVIGGRRHLDGSASQARQKHADYWGEKEIQEFWSGKAFFRPDEGSTLAYELARVIVEQMNRDWAAFTRFVMHADEADAGSAAAREYLGIDLGAYVCAMFEKTSPERWGPHPAGWSTPKD